jgi:hypothetical protein
MSMPRRQIIRPATVAATINLQRQRQLDKLRSRLEGERATLARWMSRLRRSFHAVEKSQRKVTQLERSISRFEQ